MSIRLHKEKGVNPRLTVCYKCGESVGVALLGCRDFKEVCLACGMAYIGGRKNRGDSCQGCGSDDFKREEIGEFEKIPDICDSCEKEVEDHREFVREGGIYWKCVDCGATGVIKNSPFAVSVREQLGVKPPDPCGIEFTKKSTNGLSCPACGTDVD